MRSIVVGSLLFVCLVAGHRSLVEAQPAPIKPGLWQVHSQREVDGQRVEMPDLSEQMRSLPPEARKQMEAMMKQRGVDMSGGGGMKICLTRDSLDPEQWQKHQGTCKTDYSSRTSTAWKWRTTCTDPVAETDGEATFTTTDTYTVKTVTRLTIQGKPSVTRMTLDSKWLGADCGDVKPVTSRP